MCTVQPHLSEILTTSTSSRHSHTCALAKCQACAKTAYFYNDYRWQLWVGGTLALHAACTCDVEQNTSSRNSKPTQCPSSMVLKRLDDHAIYKYTAVARASCRYIIWVHSHTETLAMETVSFSELCFLKHLTRLLAGQDFIELSISESWKTNRH